jgi:hypothetical protein
MTLLDQPGQASWNEPGNGQESGESSPDLAQASAGELAARLGELVSRLVRDEFALAQIEAKQRAKRIGVGLGAFGLAGIAVFLGACCFVAALVLGLSNVLRPWFAAIVVGAGLVALGGIVALPGWKGLNDRRAPVPADSIDSVKADVAAVRDALHR